MDNFVVRQKKHSLAAVVITDTPISDEQSNCNRLSTEQLLEVNVAQQSCPQSDQVAEVAPIGRQFQEKWINTFPWIKFDKQKNRVFCSVCCDAVANNAKLPITAASSRDIESKNAFVTNGFSSWSKALERFRAHEKSEVHRAAVEAMTHISRGHNIASALSASKQKEMKDARKALLCVLSSLRYLASGGLSVRGHTDENSNFIRLLQLRSDDVSELKSWLARSSYKWTSHEIINEMMSIMSHEVIRQLATTVREAKFYSIIVDETSDISVHEQISICIRYVDQQLQVHEIFFGFYETVSTTASTVFEIIKDSLHRLNFNVTDCRGQCYDGASNMSGSFSGVQARFLSEEPRAIYVHCLAHSLNLVVQDAMKQVRDVRDCLNTIRELILMVRSSPKRLAWFESLQGDDEEISTLRPFCPTRWCLRMVSLRTVLSNYDTLQQLLNELSENDQSETGAKANGFLAILQQFKTAFVLHLLLYVLERVETLNSALQRASLNFNEAIAKVEACRSALIYKRDNGFAELWQQSLQFSMDNNLDEPQLPRVRRLPKRLDTGFEQHTFKTPEDMFRPMFLEVIDTAISSLNNRFVNKTSSHLKEMEDFLIGTSDGTSVCNFYASDFDRNRLILHRDMLLDIMRAKSEGSISSVKDCVDFLTSSNNSSILHLLPEIAKYLRVLLTIPVSSCCAERSFSSLRRMKTYLRATMTQQRLNATAVLNVNRSTADCLNMEDIADEFIRRSPLRMNTFANRL